MCCGRGIILTWPDHGMRVTARLLGCARSTVVTWRDRYRARGLPGLRDLPRCGAPRTHGDKQRRAVAAVATTEPPRPWGSWTHARLAAHVSSLSQAFRDAPDGAAAAAPVSRSWVGRVLRDAHIRVHRVRGWLHRKPDPQFEERIAAIEAAVAVARRGQRTVLCLDEKTALPVGTPCHPDTYGPDGRRRREFEHHRAGTLAWYGTQDAGTGMIALRRAPTRMDSAAFTMVLDDLAAEGQVLAADTDLWADPVWLVDSTPVECAPSRPTVQRSNLAGFAGYGYCASHSRYFWGPRLHLVCTPAGLPLPLGAGPSQARRTPGADGRPGSGPAPAGGPARAAADRRQGLRLRRIGLLPRPPRRRTSAAGLPQPRAPSRPAAARPDPPAHRISPRHPQRPTRPGTARRAQPCQGRRPRRPAAAGAHHRDLAQPRHRPADHPIPDRLRPLIDFGLTRLALRYVPPRTTGPDAKPDAVDQLSQRPAPGPAWLLADGQQFLQDGGEDRPLLVGQVMAGTGR